MKKTIVVSILISSGLLLTGCTDPVPSTYQVTQEKTEQIQKKLQNSVPIPELTNSSERRNVAKRAETFDNEEKVSYIYLVSYGKVMAFYPIKGKVSSLRSYLTPSQQIVNTDGIPCKEARLTNTPSCSGGDGFTVDSPDIDGTYGENVGGIFFFTTDGAYVEWNGEYMMSDQALKLTQPPELVREIK